MIELILGLACFFILHAYFGYPLSLVIIGRIRGRRQVAKKWHTPYVTLIITAHNEEKRIRRKIENTIAIDYPKALLQVLVASDGSLDQTNQIVREFCGEGVELLEITERGGKERAQKAAIQQAKGEVLVFTDVATLLAPHALREIVGNFADPSVGAVSSEDRLVGLDGKPVGEGLYVRYEMWLRRLESRVGSVVGLSGSFFAARKEVCLDFSGEMQSDFRTVLSSVEMGLRAVTEPQAIGYYENVADEKLEFDRKVRTVVRGLTVFFNHLELLNPFRHGLFSYQYLCHKLLRWLVPGFLLLVFISDVFLATGSPFYFGTLILQLTFYSVAFWAWRQGTDCWGLLSKVPFYFVMVNSAILVAWWKYARGHRIVMWAPSER